MNLKQIRELAAKETIDISPFIKAIKEKLKIYPTGVDLLFPDYLCPKIEATCDFLDIPCYYAADGCLSVAPTYSALLARENIR